MACDDVHMPRLSTNRKSPSGPLLGKGKTPDIVTTCLEVAEIHPPDLKLTTTNVSRTLRNRHLYYESEAAIDDSRRKCVLYGAMKGMYDAPRPRIGQTQV